MPKDKVESMILRELSSKQTFPKVWCEKCQSPFIPRNAKDRKYLKCTICKGTSKSPSVWMPCHSREDWCKIREHFQKLNMFFMALCPRCGHLWKMARKVMGKDSRCPQCRYHRRMGSFFHQHFNHMYSIDSEDHLYNKIRKKFPKDYRFHNAKNRRRIALEKWLEIKKESRL